MLRVLLIDDDAGFTSASTELIRAEGFEVELADSCAEARAALQARDFDLILTDLVLPDGSGLDLILELDNKMTSRSVLITGYASIDSVAEAARMRVMDYLRKPLDVDYLRRLLIRVRLDQAQDTIAIKDQSGRSANFGPLVGTSEPMLAMYNLIEKVAATDVPVMICGESGTGKDLVGRAIHQLSARHLMPYLPLNCGALSPTLIGSELFGHERGGFTGATRQHKGYFERASGGTLFLDEVTEMAPDLQVQLLRVLESGKVIRLGGTREVKVDVRVISATNRSPAEVMERGHFRKDLFYRLCGFPINVPPLRERPGDVEVLARYFVALLNKQRGTHKILSEAGVRRLQEYEWPGNVRELRNVIERAYVMSSTSEIRDEDMKLESSWPQAGGDMQVFTVGNTLDDVERELIYAALRYFNGNKRRAAQSLGISLKTLYNRLKRYQGA